MPTLDWLNRDAAFSTAAAVPTRVLRPHEACSRFGDPGSEPGNLLVHGDNLEALQALLPFYRGRVKCIFIDPPYNTKSAFEHYDDNLEHSQWLSMMLPRLQLLREFLREDGSIWVTLDDNEAHYLRVLGDEVFGREQFIIDIAWRKRDGHPRVKRWVLNLDSEPVHGFWLPTSFGRFYPDFVCELEDGRIFVAEYKGEHLRAVPREIEKAQVGKLWAERSNGRAIFAMLFRLERGMSVSQQIESALSSD